jgi:hypothetical protein
LSFHDEHAVRNAWIGWALLFLATAGIIIAAGNGRSVVINYRLGALDWIAGRSLYNFSGIGGFVYFPQSAILFIPFALLPETLGEVVWRLASIITFAVGLRRFARLADGRTGTEFFPLMSLVAIPLVWDCARNGQATLAMTGLMLLSAHDIAVGRWWRATVWLLLSVAVKPLAIVLVLLFMAIERPLLWRGLAGIGAFVLSPFVTQHPSYVLQQYTAFLHNSTTAAHMGVVSQGWAHLFSALRVAGAEVPERAQTVLRLVAAVATLALSFVARRRFAAPRAAVFVFALAAVYLVLFSPRTENNTYMLLAPVIALFLAEAFLVEKRSPGGLLLGGLALGLVSGRQVQRLLLPHAEAVWLSPLLAACFAGYLTVRLFTYPAAHAEEKDPGTADG